MKWTFEFFFQNARHLNGLLNISLEIFPKETKKRLKILGKKCYSWNTCCCYVKENSELYTVDKRGKFLRELWNLDGDVQNWHVNFKTPFKFQKYWSRVTWLTVNWKECSCKNSELFFLTTSVRFVYVPNVTSSRPTSRVPASNVPELASLLPRPRVPVPLLGSGTSRNIPEHEKKN